MATAGLALAACDDSSYEYHSTYFLPQATLPMETYADQKLDSVRVVSYDTWSLTNECEWMEIYKEGKKAPFTVEIKPGYWENNRLDLVLQPNTTEELRSTYITVTSSYGKIGTLQKNLIQLPFHHITWPGVKTTTVEGKTVYTFDLNLSNNGFTEDNRQPFIQFKPFDDDARLVSDSQWLRPRTTSGFIKGVATTVLLDCDENTTSAPRTAILSLQTGQEDTKVTTKITITQQGER